MDFIINIVISILTVISTGYLFFMFLGKKWLDEKFSQRLESYRHEQAKELENTKLRINTEFNRITKIHEKEIDVLPIAWLKLTTTIRKLSQLTSEFQSYEDLNKLSSEDVKTYLKTTFLHPSAQERIVKSSNKTNAFIEEERRQKIYDTYIECQKFIYFIDENSLFLTEDIKVKFQDIAKIIKGITVDKEVGHDYNDREMINKTYGAVEKDVLPIKDEIEKLVQKRWHLYSTL